MELVEYFKDEVNSILDHRPPVSKAKMVQITRAAIKATRFYKHVVMAVERFIERCPPEYKIAGLYVIDSVVRQSRHKNGKERDIFGPRFSKNLQSTFDNLFSGCLHEDRPRIVRVLNLWQKNGVFNSKTIQPLLDLACKAGSGSNSSSQNELSTVNNISKSVLDFDYGEDDDDEADETPTEAEPPLSSTDPVLERWNRLMKGQASSTEQMTPTKSPPPPPPTIEKTSVNKAKETEKEEERKRKCFPDIKDRHVTLCSSTLWLGHVPKSVTEADISDAFGEYGTINSIDLIPPRGCSYVCMDRRQDAMKALAESSDLRLKGSKIKTAWAPGKGLKEYKELKDYFELSIGCAFIPYSKINSNIDFDTLEEGGVIDEESMSMEMIETRKKKAKEKLEKQHEPPVSMMPLMIQPPPPFYQTPVMINREELLQHQCMLYKNQWIQ